jgi:ATP-dependent DNA helicase RecG
MPDVTLDTIVQFLPGVGSKRAPLLHRLGIETVEDLLWYLPRDILDFSHVCQPSQLAEGKPATVRGTVVDLDARGISGNRTLTAALLDCGSDYVRGVWFNQPWMIKRLQHGQQVLFSGKPKFKQGRWEFPHPEVQWLEPDDDAPADRSTLILTRYRLTEGLTVRELRRIIRNAIDAVIEQIPDPAPEPLLKRLKFPHLATALRQVHLPESAEQYRRARERIIFDDLFEFQLGLALRRRTWRARCNAPVLERTAKIDARIRRLFPFTYTEGQNRAVREIADDLKSGYAMHRLLQADVGAGKTVVAIDTMLIAIAHGWQAVLMAPTELLTSQHWQTVDVALRHSRVERVLLTGSLTEKERRTAHERIANGSVQLIVGTQAVIQRDVRFHKLGVVVIDEQHKFGVAQRAKFSAEEQGTPPHILVMTATPIPRTLCLTQFGDLDVTLVKDRPQGRQPVLTSKVTGPAARKKAWEFIIEKLKSGRQLYIVCPFVDADDPASGAASAPRSNVDRYELDNHSTLDRGTHVPRSPRAGAEQTFSELQRGRLRDFRVGLVHGRMKRDERERIMDAFRDRELDALVATTVIEVGVDVPNATQMVILDAERFGLSQLHQIRGRITRGKHRGYCFLFTESESAEALSRLATLERSSDGFEVAEQDFELRGPGDILGIRQHGALPLRFANFIRDEKMLKRAREEAFHLVQSGEFDQPEFAAWKRTVLDRFSQLMDLPRSG